MTTEVVLGADGIFHRVTNGWLEQDGGFITTGVYRALGRKALLSGVFRWQVDPDGGTTTLANEPFDAGHFHAACRPRERCFDLTWPLFTTAIRTTDGRIIQVGELIVERENLGLYIGYGLLMAAGMAGGATTIPPPADLATYQSHDLFLVRWESPDSTVVLTVPRAATKTAPHAVDQSFNCAGPGGAMGSQFLFHDLERARLLAVDVDGNDPPQPVVEACHQLANYYLPPSRSMMVLVRPSGFAGPVRLLLYPLP